MQWTEGRIKSFITSVIRGGFRRWPPKYITLSNAFHKVQENKKTGRQAKHYLCASCKKSFPSKEVQVDHISPVVDPKIGFTTWDDFISRLFCTEENLQVLCTSCHKKKTTEEKQQRKKYAS